VACQAAGPAPPLGQVAARLWPPPPRLGGGKGEKRGQRAEGGGQGAGDGGQGGGNGCMG
jgi:hypothetical protein